jgi:hypothetical protein
MYASFLNLPVEGRHSRALYLELFTVPSPLMAFYEAIKLRFTNSSLLPLPREFAREEQETPIFSH